MLPKIWETLVEAPEVYENTASFIEAADWIILQLTGKMTRSISTSGYKGMWGREKGYPESDFFKVLNPKLENVVEEKLTGEIHNLGEEAGKLKSEWAEKLNLTTELSVAVANIDSFVTVPAAGVSDPIKW